MLYYGMCQGRWLRPLDVGREFTEKKLFASDRRAPMGPLRGIERRFKEIAVNLLLPAISLSSLLLFVENYILHFGSALLTMLTISGILPVGVEVVRRWLLQ